MKIFKILILLATSLLASCSVAKTAPHNVAHEKLIIYYDPEVGNEALLRAAKQYGSEILYIYNNKWNCSHRSARHAASRCDKILRGHKRRSISH